MSDLAALPSIRTLLERGAHVYTVGGTVRDALLGHPRKDVDVLVTGVPQQTLIRILRRYGRVQLAGRAFGVIKFLPHRWDGPPIDVALPRTEVSTGIGHRDFEVAFDHTLPVEVDLGRRDFTINAMALDLADDHLVDPFNGREDLAQRILRQVSPAAFPEDPLRMLRGVQLATRFDLYVVADTRDAMRAHAASIATVAQERIAEELRKLFMATSPSHGFLLMQEVGLLANILPELARLGEVSPDTFAGAIRRLDALKQHEVLLYRDHIDMMLATLMQDCGLPDALQGPPATPQRIAACSARLAQQRLEVLRVSMIGAQLSLIGTLVTHSAFEINALSSGPGLRHFAHQVGPDAAFMLFDLRLADRLGKTHAEPINDLLALRERLRAELERQVPLSIKDLVINGRDLQRLGVEPGPRMGQILQALLNCVLNDPSCNCRDRLFKVVQTKFPDALS
jgi:tRNA nucleotidyltransferase/poly(A) polymerase